MAGKNEDISLDDYAQQEKKTEFKGNNRSSNGWNDNSNNRNFNNQRKPYFKNNNFNNNNNQGNRFNNFRNNGGRQNEGGNYSRRNNYDNNDDDFSPKQKIVYIVKDQEERTVPEHKKRILKVYNLDPSINNEEFYQLFVKYGSVEQSKVDTDKKGKSEEKGYIVFRDHASAKRAIDDLNGVELEGRIITVEFMKEGDTIGDSSRSYNKDNADRQGSGILNKRIQKDDRFERHDFGYKKDFDDENRGGSRNDRPRYNNNGNGGFNRKFNRG